MNRNDFIGKHPQVNAHNKFYIKFHYVVLNYVMTSMFWMYICTYTYIFSFPENNIKNTTYARIWKYGSCIICIV